MNEKQLALLERFKKDGERATLNIVLSEWAFEKLSRHETLDEHSLREWANNPKCSKGKSLALLNFLDSINASAKSDK
ncbi:hypothetical protein [Pasteurella sp. 19428wF3_WM03]|uniref:hypothetical protein n=1 Tax=Pasteurella sp. 19428wF3_WM03 TaxID=2782473 RepID=UPI0018833419